MRGLPPLERVFIEEFSCPRVRRSTDRPLLRARLPEAFARLLSPLLWALRRRGGRRTLACPARSRPHALAVYLLLGFAALAFAVKTTSGTA